VPALAIGVSLFLLSYMGFAFTEANIVLVTACFVAAGLATSAVHTTEVALLEGGDEGMRHSTEGVLIATRAVANFSASVVTGILWSIVSVRAALLYLGGWLLISLVGLVVASRGHRHCAARAA
jgi:predicted MFS family arabinose efflux permease